MGFRTKISMKLVYQYMVIFFYFSPTSSHIHQLQVENCDSNSQLVVDEDDYGKFGLERVKAQNVVDAFVFAIIAKHISSLNILYVSTGL